MLLNIMMSGLLFFFFLVFGNLMMFIDGNAYYLLLPYVLSMFLLYRVYQENCKAIEARDFVFTLFIVFFDLFIYNMFDVPINMDVFSYLYLATFVPFLSFATTIRFKSLI